MAVVKKAGRRRQTIAAGRCCERSSGGSVVGRRFNRAKQQNKLKKWIQQLGFVTGKVKAAIASDDRRQSNLDSSAAPAGRPPAGEAVRNFCNFSNITRSRGPQRPVCPPRVSRCLVGTLLMRG